MTKRISRRTLLQGTGAALALPLLDAMLPVKVRAFIDFMAEQLAPGATQGVHAE